MSFVNFIRLISPDGNTWENYSRRKWGVSVTRYHGWLDGKRTKAWVKVLSRQDASLRWRALQNKGWRETVRRNPDQPWTRIGEWWIDDSGNALYADQDVGDMGHEAYVIDHLTRRLRDYLDLDSDDEHVGNLYDRETKKEIQEKMKEDEFDGTIEEFVEEAAKQAWKDPEQRKVALDIVEGRGDARKYGMQYDGWIRVAGHGFECWNLTATVMKHMADGIYDAGVEDIGDDEIFEIYVHNTGMHYTEVPWSVINGGDPGALRVYGTKNNPWVKLKPAAKVPKHLLARGIKVEMEHTGSKRAARVIASQHIAEDRDYYKKLATIENPVMSYAAAHRWEPMAKARGVSAVARSERGFMRAYQRAGTWAKLDPWWKARRHAFVARHMAQGRHEKLWKPNKSGGLTPSRRALSLIMWAYYPPKSFT